MNTRTRFALGALSVVLLGSVAAQSASAAPVEYWLRADEFSRNLNQPSGLVPVVVWEYRSCGPNFAGPCAALNNGGVLRAADGDTVIIHLQNMLRRTGGVLITLPGVAAYGGLPVPTSIMAPGLPAPTFQSGVTAPGVCPVALAAPVEVAGGGRIRSFTSEVANVQSAANAVGTYCWTNVKAGTYLFQSGTHPAVQVQMGLKGALVVGAPAGSCSGPLCAYPGIPYDREVVAVFSEIDPAVHAKVADSSYGDATAVDPMTSTIFYEPKYFFVDGEAFDGATAVNFRSKGSPAAGSANQRILLRLVNAGIEMHAPLLNGERFTLVAEDGNPYTASAALHPQYSTLLAAGKTLDAIMTPGLAGTYVLFDRHRALANSGGGAGGANASGMLVNLVVAP
jgi:FtsP/CotA-like multicopper oxidase with cupredoxin domain